MKQRFKEMLAQEEAILNAKKDIAKQVNKSKKDLIANEICSVVDFLNEVQNEESIRFRIAPFGKEEFKGVLGYYPTLLNKNHKEYLENENSSYFRVQINPCKNFDLKVNLYVTEDLEPKFQIEQRYGRGRNEIILETNSLEDILKTISSFIVKFKHVKK